MKVKQPSMLKKLRGSQKGFTLIELIIVIALTGIIAAAATMAIHQVLTGTALSNDLNTAINQVRNAGHWISRDALMAQSVEPDEDDDTGFPLTLTWTEYGDDADEHQVVYRLENNKLQREHYTNRDTNPDPDATTFVAQFIDPTPAKTNCDFTDGVLTVNITAEVNDKKETRTFQVKPRPDPVS